MKRSFGFTLIELVIVIIILSLLASVTVPKILNYRNETNKSILKGTLAALRSANELVYAKASIEGKESLPPQDYHNSVESWLIINGRRVNLNYGYMQASKWNIETVVNLPESDWKLVQAASGQFGLVYIVLNGSSGFDDSSIGSITASNCYISYGYEQYNYNPQYKISTNGC